MEPTEVKKETSTKKTTGNSTRLRIAPSTKRRLGAELSRINKKPFGKDVTADQLITHLLPLMNDQVVRDLQEESMSNMDRWERRYVEYVKVHGPISKDAYMGKYLVMEVEKDGSATPVKPNADAVKKEL